MCGICGFIHADPERAADPALAERMADVLRHRGPDDAGCWSEGPAVLAHRRLSVLDPTPDGHQPWLSTCGRYVLVFNGEIYNFLDLRQELEQAGCRFRTRCDTEVLAAALETWGESALTRLNGMFAFAWYDRREGSLWLARDRLGIKPLYYAHHQGIFVFASELDALRQSGLSPTALSASAVTAYFTYLYVPEPDTIFEGVQQVRPGEMVVFERGRVEKKTYWQLPSRPNADWTLDSAAEAYRALVEDAVRLHRVSDVPLGAFLSGGVDSASVTALLSRLPGPPLKTFTIGFEDAQADELRFARIAARHFGTEHFEEICRPDLVALLPEIVRHFGAPFADSSALPMWLVSRLARQHVTVALSGDGGDELFAGYTWCHMNWRVARYRRWPAPVRHAVGGLLGLLPGTPGIEKVRRFHADAALSPRESLRRRQTCFTPPERAALFQGYFGRQAEEGAVDRFLEHAEASQGWNEDDWMLYQDTVMYLPGDILTKVDRMSMAHGLEARVPLLDYRLVEFAATVPFALKFDGRTSKRVMKHALRDLLPPELLRQRKQGFSIPIHRWFRESLGRHFEEAVLAPDARSRAYLRPEAIRTLLDKHRSFRENYGHHLWALLVFEHWLRQVNG